MTEVERCWPRIHAADTGMPFPYDPDQTGQDFKALDDAAAAANIKAFKQEIEHARAAAAGNQADDVMPSHGHHPKRIRYISWHLLPAHDREVRAPNGHAGLVGERIDGVTGA